MRRSEDISPTRVGPTPSPRIVSEEGQAKASGEGEEEIACDGVVELAREEEAVSTQRKLKVSSFILANTRADKRLPPDEYFPSGPLGARTNHRNLYRYFESRTAAPQCDEPSTNLFGTGDMAGKQANHERSASKRSVHFDHDSKNPHGRLSKINSAVTRKSSPKGGRPAKPALKISGNSESSKHPSEADGPSKLPAKCEDDVAAMNKPIVLDKGKGKATAVDPYGANPNASPFHASDSSDDTTIERRLDREVKGDTKAVDANDPARTLLGSPQWESISEESPGVNVKGRPVTGQESSQNYNAQTDGSALEDDIAVDDRSSQQDAPLPGAPATSGGRTPIPDQIQDRSGVATSGNNAGLLRTESPDRKPPPNSHPKTPDRTCPIRPTPPMRFAPDPHRPDFTIRRYSGDISSSPLISKAEQLLADKLVTQRDAKQSLGIQKIPSPTYRPTKTLTDQAIGFMFSDKKKLRPTEQRDPEEQANVVLD